MELGTKLIEGPVTVTVNVNNTEDSTIRDYADYAVFKSDVTFDYVKDTSVAVVTVQAASQKSVTLAFNKPVKFTALSLYHSVKYAVDNHSMGSTGSEYQTEWTFNFSSNPLPEGTVKLFLVNDGSTNNQITDGYGIKVPDQTLICEVKDEKAAEEETAEIEEKPGTTGTQIAQGPIIYLPKDYVVFPVVPSKPDEEKPGIDDPGYDGPGIDDPGYDGPGIDDPGYDGPGIDDPGYDGPGYDGPGVDDPDKAG